MNLAAVLAVALTFACAGRSPSQEVEAAVVVMTQCGGSAAAAAGSGFQLGTGVAVSGDRVLTALHVVTCDDGSQPSVGVYQGTGSGVAAAVVEVVLPRIDAARLLVPAGGLVSSPVSVGPTPKVGDADLTIVTAWPLWQVKHCIVEPPQDTGSDPAGPADLLPGESRLLVGCDVEPGNSGGAAYDGRGRLVGLVSWSARSSEFAGLAPLQSAPWTTQTP